MLWSAKQNVYKHIITDAGIKHFLEIKHSFSLPPDTYLHRRKILNLKDLPKEPFSWVITSMCQDCITTRMFFYIGCNIVNLLEFKVKMKDFISDMQQTFKLLYPFSQKRIKSQEKFKVTLLLMMIQQSVLLLCKLTSVLEYVFPPWQKPMENLKNRNQQWLIGYTYTYMYVSRLHKRNITVFPKHRSEFGVLVV